METLAAELADTEADWRLLGEEIDPLLITLAGEVGRRKAQKDQKE